MGLGDLVALRAHAVHRAVDRAPGRTPAEDEEVGVVGPVDGDGRDVVGDPRHLGGADVDHVLVVVGVVAHVAGAVLLLDATDAVHQVGRAGQRPRAGQRVGIAEVGPEDLLARGQRVVGRRGEGGGDVGQVGDIGEQPGLGAVGQVAVGQDDHRRAVLEGDPSGLDGREEAVARAVGRDDRQRRLAVTPVVGHQEVGRLGLRGQSGGGAAALHVDDQQRQLEAHRQPHRLGLEGDARTAVVVTARWPAVRGADGRADAGDLVLGLEGAHAEGLVLRELVEDVRGRRDRIRAEEQGQVGDCEAAMSPTPAPCCR